MIFVMLAAADEAYLPRISIFFDQSGGCQSNF
jgi:hypothetical protein